MWFQWAINRLAETMASGTSRPSMRTADYDETLIRGDIQRALRRALYYRGNHNPDPDDLRQMEKKVIKGLSEQYGDLSTVRVHAAGDALAPLVEAAVDATKFRQFSSDYY